MKLYNKGGRVFHYGLKPTDFIAPATFKEIEDAKVAEKLIADYPTELVLADDHRKHLAKHASAIAKKEEELAEQKKVTAEKDAEIKKLQKQLENMQRLVSEPSPMPAQVDVSETTDKAGKKTK